MDGSSVSSYKVIDAVDVNNVVDLFDVIDAMVNEGRDSPLERLSGMACL